MLYSVSYGRDVSTLFMVENDAVMILDVFRTPPPRARLFFDLRRKLLEYLKL